MKLCTPLFNSRMCHMLPSHDPKNFTGKDDLDKADSQDEEDAPKDFTGGEGLGKVDSQDKKCAPKSSCCSAGRCTKTGGGEPGRCCFAATAFISCPGFVSLDLQQLRSLAGLCPVGVLPVVVSDEQVFASTEHRPVGMWRR